MHEDLFKIIQRRSVREFTKEVVTDEELHEILKVGMSAPSAMQKDSWHFIVIRKPFYLSKLVDILPGGQPLKTANVAILVCGDRSIAHRGQLSYLVQECAAATQNILLAASMMNIGSCWLGVHPVAERVALINDLLSIPSGIVPVSLIALGRAQHKHAARTRYNRSRVHKETW